MSQLQTNITNLQSLLEVINNLPEAGKGQPDLINFTIQYGIDTSPTILNCQAESGMSLGSWIFSSYNNITSLSYGNSMAGYFINENQTIPFIFAAGVPSLSLNGATVTASNIIQPNGVYTATYASSDDW